MPRLEGEKQSVLPYILGIALIAAIGAGAYFYTQSNQADSAANNTTETFRRPAPANSISDISATGNAVSNEAEVGNTATENSATENSVTTSVSRTSPTTTIKGGSSP